MSNKHRPFSRNDLGIQGLESFDYGKIASLIEQVKQEVNTEHLLIISTSMVYFSRTQRISEARSS